MPKQIREYVFWITFRCFGFVAVWIWHFDIITDGGDSLFRVFPLQGWIGLNILVGLFSLYAVVDNKPLLGRLSLSLNIGTNLLLALLLLVFGTSSPVTTFISVLLITMMGKDFAILRLPYADPELVQRVLDREEQTDLMHKEIVRDRIISVIEQQDEKEDPT